ncbi:MAG: Trk family potassium uptake protein, partial [Clostridia bacterium]|nr:Trk family potassium uptake protein [Clostridia bacterium]
LLPFSTKENHRISFVDALFTATSATCVTGLTTVSTAGTFSAFGQVVILILVQIGGLGFMTFTSFFYSMLGRKMSLRRKLNMSEDLAQSNMNDLKSIVIKIMLIAFGSEALGVLFLTIGFMIQGLPFGKSLWFGIFHSVSAFCNSGFEIVSFNDTSIIDYNNNYLILLTIALLVGIGSVGFIVLVDISNNKRFSKWSLHTKVVVLMTLALTFGGAFIFWLAERKNPDTIGNMSLLGQWVNCYFHSVSCRTAGFANIPVEKMSNLSIFLSMAYMLVGAAPGSAGGGIKVTTLFIIIAYVIATLSQKKEFIVDKKAIGTNTLAKAASTVLLAIFILFISCILIFAAEGSENFFMLLFEQISAYSTCGLAMKEMPNLSTFSRLVIIVDMYLGKVGAFTFFMSFAKSHRETSKIKYPEANINV